MTLNSITASANLLQVTPKIDSSDKAQFSETNKSASNVKEPSEPLDLSAQELRQVRELQSIDKRVRAHETAHLNAAAGIAKGGASFTTRMGPDGQQYAVGGEVSIDTAAIAGDPQATVFKARQIQQAAQAPLNPSAQDKAIAASAYALEQQALVELKDLAALEAQLANNKRSDTGKTQRVNEVA